MVKRPPSGTAGPCVWENPDGPRPVRVQNGSRARIDDRPRRRFGTSGPVSTTYELHDLREENAMPSTDLDALVAPLRSDVVSGAATIGRTAAELVRRAAVRLPADSTGELHDAIRRLLLRILDAQPAMAPLVALAREALRSVDPAHDLRSARGAVARAAESFREELERSGHRVGRRVRRHLPRRGTVLTLSSSSSVREALLGAGDRQLRVVCLEGRPMSEGRGLARTLVGAGIETVVAVDAAAAHFVDRSELVLLGADSVGDRGVVNKIGSRALAVLADRAGVPVVVAADTTKLLPPGFPQPLDEDRPADEVWSAPGGVTVWNRYFEALPTTLVSVVVTEEDDLSPAETDTLRADLDVPEELRRWAIGDDG